MSTGNGHAALATGESMRLILNGLMYERGLGQYAISREAWGLPAGSD